MYKWMSAGIKQCQCTNGWVQVLISANVQMDEYRY